MYMQSLTLFGVVLSCSFFVRSRQSIEILFSASRNYDVTIIWLVESSVKDEFLALRRQSVCCCSATTSMCADILYICKVFVLREVASGSHKLSSTHYMQLKIVFYSLLFLLYSFSWRVEKTIVEFGIHVFPVVCVFQNSVVLFWGSLLRQNRIDNFVLPVIE